MNAMDHDFDAAHNLSELAAMRLRGILNAVRIAAVNGEGGDPIFDLDMARNVLDVAVDELGRLTDASDEMARAHREAMAASGAPPPPT